MATSQNTISSLLAFGGKAYADTEEDKQHLKVEKPKTLDEGNLVEKAKKGDTDAYRELVEMYQDRVRVLAYRTLGSWSDAEDVVQDGFIKAYRNLDSFRGSSSFYTWLYRIIYNLAIDLSRKKYRQSEFGGEGFISDAVNRFEGGTATAGSVARPEEEFERREKGEAIAAALSKLSDEHRVVVSLREIDGLSYAEISDVLGISKGTVMSRLHHGRKKLQSYLEEYNPAANRRSVENGVDAVRNNNTVMKRKEHVS